MREQSCILPRDLWFWLRVVRGCEGFVNLADKSRAWLIPRCKGSEGDLSRRVNCYASYAGTEVWLLFNEVGWLFSQCYTRGRVVVVVGGGNVHPRKR